MEEAEAAEAEEEAGAAEAEEEAEAEAEEEAEGEAEDEPRAERAPEPPSRARHKGCTSLGPRPCSQESVAPGAKLGAGAEVHRAAALGKAWARATGLPRGC